MSVEKRDIVGIALVLLTIAVSVVTYPRLPEEMAVHFGTSGEPNRFADRWLALTLIPLTAAGLVILFRVLPAIDPLGDSFEEFGFYYDLIAVLTVGTVAYAHLIVVAWNLGLGFDVGQVLAPVLGVLFFALGYVVENARRNWFVGIRTPWTLSSEKVWDETHQRSGILFKLAGLIALLAVPFPEYFVYFVVVPVLIAALVPTVYSFVLYRRTQTE